MEWLLIIGVLTGVYLASNIGANDIGNSMGTAVGSGVIKMRQALIVGALFMFLGAIFLSSNVIKTISGGIVDIYFITPIGAVITTLTAGLWVSISILRKTPVSGSHSIVGAIFGYGLVYAGLNNIKWNSLLVIGLSWVSSPLLGALIGFIFYYSLRSLILEKVQNIAVSGRIEKIFSYIQILSSCFAALGIGAIDIAAATGVMIAVMGIGTGTDIKLLGTFGLVTGILIAGNRIVGTVGKRITNLVPTRGVSAQISAASVILTFAFLGMPISPTQTLVGSVIGVGLARRTSDVGGDVVKQILSSWVFTFPACAIISGILTGLTYQCFYNISI
ncbi:MAG: anion permease [Methanobacterium sp.]|jgi:PiT family inorganic phosphate transporter